MIKRLIRKAEEKKEEIKLDLGKTELSDDTKNEILESYKECLEDAKENGMFKNVAKDLLNFLNTPFVANAFKTYSDIQKFYDKLLTIHSGKLTTYLKPFAKKIEAEYKFDQDWTMKYSHSFKDNSDSISFQKALNERFNAGLDIGKNCSGVNVCGFVSWSF